MADADPASLQQPHRRYNPLIGEWVLVSASRTRRPWQGAVEVSDGEALGPYDPDCYLCPRNDRANGAVNPDYESTFVFTNDFAALNPESHAVTIQRGLLRAEGQPGTCRVVCFSPRHDLTLSRMALEDMHAVIDVWAEQTAELGRSYGWVQVFENRGQMMGASNPHPHGQIWASNALPVEPAKEDRQQRQHLADRGRPLLVDYAGQESGGPRVVLEDDEWVVVVPFWAVWPFETLVIPRRPVQRLPDLTAAERRSLAATIRRLLAKYDNLFRFPFPYSMGWHGAPHSAGSQEHWTLHAHFYPPLLRSASVRKYMVGYELLAEAQRDITPERAAAQLVKLNEPHYLNAG